MALDANGRAQLDEFFAGLSGHASAFQHATFSYVALASGNDWIIVAGAIVLHALAPAHADRLFSSPMARAGMFRLENAGDAKSFLVSLSEGAAETPHGRFHFPAAGDASPGRHGMSHTPFNPIGNQARIDTAQIMGEQWAQFIRQPMLDWSLRASETPYDGLVDLLGDFSLPPIAPAISVHVYAQAGIMIDASSRLDGDQASLAVGLASGLSPRLATLGVLVRHQRDLERRFISSTDLSWRLETNRQVGEVTIRVPPGALLHCFACYDGIAHHRYWVADTSRTQNHRRAALETVEQGLQALSDAFAEAQGDRGQARRFEAAVSWLVWLLGFSPAHLGDTAKTQDAPDILVATPLGHIALIECTTGVVKNEKLLNLHTRALAVRQRLDASNLGGSQVLAVLVSARPEREVEPTRDSAAKLGIWIVDGDDLAELLNRTAFVPDAERIFKEGQEALALRRSQADAEAQSHSASTAMNACWG